MKDQAMRPQDTQDAIIPGRGELRLLHYLANRGPSRQSDILFHTINQLIKQGLRNKYLHEQMNEVVRAMKSCYAKGWTTVKEPTVSTEEWYMFALKSKHSLAENGKKMLQANLKHLEKL